MDIVNFKIAQKLKEKGFNEGCEYTFYNNYRVRDEIYEKHPGLSDDGYEDLRKKYGGPYKDEEVYGYYIEPLKLYSRNSTIGVNPITKQKVPTNQLYSCPNISQILKWLREKHATHIEISLGRNGWYFEIIQYEYYEEEKEYGCKLITISVINDSYEEAALAGIEYVLDNLI